MRIFILLTAILINLFANDSDTKLILEMMKENNKNIIRIMQQNSNNLENQMKSMEKRLENQIKAVKTDLENQIKATNLRIDDLGKRIDDLGKRIGDNGKRIDDNGKRIDDVNNRIDTLSGYILALFSGLMTFVGFIYWDRRTMISKAKDEVKNEINSVYVQRDNFNEVIETLKDLATVNQEIAKVVNRHNLKTV